MSHEIIDKQLIIEAVRTDEFYSDSFDLFREFHPELESQLRTAARQHDATRMLEVTHMLKSRLLFLNCNTLAERVSHLEAQARDLTATESVHHDSGCIASVDELLQQIQSALTEIHAIIQSNG